jgi:hypothetical protein
MLHCSINVTLGLKPLNEVFGMHRRLTAVKVDILLAIKQVQQGARHTNQASEVANTPGIYIEAPRDNGICLGDCPPGDQPC